ncbi:MAG TPA: phosphate signaling complex protein PhoU [Burkholderiaceae bacterium]|nr:phosphate signaling complex protein PhoU [Burkholderiaceae bacterium]
MDKHLSTQFDSELRSVSTRVLEMGGLVEAQITLSIEALASMNADTAQQVTNAEEAVNQFEIDIDRDLSTIIARRQPAAGDLRLLMAISRITANLERVGDEAERIARMVQSISNTQTTVGTTLKLPSIELRLASDLARKQLRKALDAFARLDSTDCVNILREDDLIDQEFNSFVRNLITYMMEDPKTISASLDLLFIAKAIERIGDHAKNIAESVIYIVKGTDVRHSSFSAIENAIGQTQ